MMEDIVDAVLRAYEKPDTQKARIALADTLAVAAAGAGLPRAKRQAEALAPEAHGRPVTGLWRESTMLEAAVAEAFLAHSLELDDWLAPGYTHAGSVAVPSVLTAAWGETIREGIRLLSAGYEAALQVGQALGRPHYKAFHATATVGTAVSAVIGALAAAPGDPGPVEAALGLALAYSGGLWVVNEARALYKPLSPAMAVARGLTLARAALVQQAPVPGALEWACQWLHGSCTLGGLWGGLAHNGFKFYPACRHSHTAIEAAERLHSEIAGEEPVRVMVFTYEEAVRVAGKRKPQSIEEARFSLSHLVATALVTGRVDIQTLEASLGDPAVARLERIVELYVDEDYTRAYPVAEPARVEVETMSGTYSVEVLYPRGSPKRPPTRMDIMEKTASLSRWLGDPRPSLLASAALGVPEGSPLSSILLDIMGLD